MKNRKLIKGKAQWKKQANKRKHYRKTQEKMLRLLKLHGDEVNV